MCKLNETIKPDMTTSPVSFQNMLRFRTVAMLLRLCKHRQTVYMPVYVLQLAITLHIHCVTQLFTMAACGTETFSEACLDLITLMILVNRTSYWAPPLCSPPSDVQIFPSAPRSQNHESFQSRVNCYRVKWVSAHFTGRGGGAFHLLHVWDSLRR